MIQTNDLAEYLRVFNTALIEHQYEKRNGALISSAEWPKEVRIMETDKYCEFFGKKIETSILELNERCATDIYFMFKTEDKIVGASQIAKVFPERRKTFQERFIDAIVIHAMALGNVVSENRLLFPQDLLRFVKPANYDVEALEKKYPRLFNLEVPSIGICSENESPDAILSLTYQKPS